jgi:hypothetical protein
MTRFVGLDSFAKITAICVVDDAGRSMPQLSTFCRGIRLSIGHFRMIQTE